jgi:hypothetical protein
MTPETKPFVSLRQRRATSSQDPAQPAGAPRPTTPAVPASEPVVSWTPPTGPKNSGPRDSGPEDTAPGVMAEVADRLHRTYTSPDRPASASPERLAGVSLWALLLVLGGAVVGLRAMLAQLGGSGTGLAGSLTGLTMFGGLVGLGLTIAAFLTIAAKRLPWMLLGAATAVLFTLLVLTTLA